MVEQTNKNKFDKPIIRSISALVLIPPVIGIVILGSPYFQIMVTIGCLILITEWIKLCDLNFKQIPFGVIYISISCFSLIQLRSLNSIGCETVLALFIVVWAADTGAFLVGSYFGGRKLAPRISPNKTWSGLFGGIFFATLAGLLIAVIIKRNNIGSIAIMSASIGVISQLGDLLESQVKRFYGKKDSGTVIPGHGGLLDRVDGLLPAATVMWLISYLLPQKSFLF